MQVSFNEIDIKLHYIELNRLEIEKYLKLYQQSCSLHQEQACTSSREQFQISGQRMWQDLTKIYQENRSFIETNLIDIEKLMKSVVE